MTEDDLKQLQEAQAKAGVEAMTFDERVNHMKRMLIAELFKVGKAVEQNKPDMAIQAAMSIGTALVVETVIGIMTVSHELKQLNAQLKESNRLASKVSRK